MATSAPGGRYDGPDGRLNELTDITGTVTTMTTPGL